MRLRPIKFSVSIVLVLTMTVFFSACGRLGPPLPPEAFSPQAVQYLETFPELHAVRFAWESPGGDLRGQELESMDGYRIYRRELLKEADLVEDEDEFEIITSVEDKHVKVREELRDAAKLAGKPARNISAEPALKIFEYTDSDVQPGKTYLYKIVPFNQDDVEGQVLQLVRVLFRGESSEIAILEQDAFEDVLG
ncbi:hypothetical protein OAO01_05120 [Oligoflexia bacterium]|nr:hypothetical protein [Oligoflexia bacterium]